MQPAELMISQLPVSFGVHDTRNDFSELQYMYDSATTIYVRQCRYKLALSRQLAGRGQVPSQPGACPGPLEVAAMAPSQSRTCLPCVEQAATPYESKPHEIKRKCQSL